MARFRNLSPSLVARAAFESRSGNFCCVCDEVGGNYRKIERSDGCACMMDLRLGTIPERANIAYVTSRQSRSHMMDLHIGSLPGRANLVSCLWRCCHTTQRASVQETSSLMPHRMYTFIYVYIYLDYRFRLKFSATRPKAHVIGLLSTLALSQAVRRLMEAPKCSAILSGCSCKSLLDC